MPTVNIDQPIVNGIVSAELAYLDTHTNDRKAELGLSFLHYNGSGSSNPFHAFKYYKYMSVIFRRWKELLDGIKYDAVISAPSSRRNAEPYMAVALTCRTTADDLSSQFSKESGAKAGSMSSVAEFAPFLQYREPPATKQAITPVAKINQLLIVDDVYSRGITAGAIIQHLLGGNIVKEDTKYVIAAPLWAGPTAIPLTTEQRALLTKTLNIP